MPDEYEDDDFGDDLEPIEPTRPTHEETVARFQAYADRMFFDMPEAYRLSVQEAVADVAKITMFFEELPPPDRMLHYCRQGFDTGMRATLGEHGTHAASLTYEGKSMYSPYSYPPDMKEYPVLDRKLSILRNGISHAVAGTDVAANAERWVAFVADQPIPTLLGYQDEYQGQRINDAGRLSEILSPSRGSGQGR